MSDLNHRMKETGSGAPVVGDSNELLLDGYMGELDYDPNSSRGITPASGMEKGTDIIEKGFQTFLRELPGLLLNSRNDRKLVAYHGEKQVAIASSQKQLLKKCVQQKVPEGEIMVECIAPYPLGS